jgi:hypothetical protein
MHRRMQADVEAFLARLLVDPDLRERFLADPERVAAEQGLSPEEARALAATNPDDLRNAARSFAHKRAAAPRFGWRRHFEALGRWLGGAWR